MSHYTYGYYTYPGKFQPGGIQLSILPHSSPLAIEYADVREHSSTFQLKTCHFWLLIMKHDTTNFICAGNKCRGNHSFHVISISRRIQIFILLPVALTVLYFMQWLFHVNLWTVLQSLGLVWKWITLHVTLSAVTLAEFSEYKRLGDYLGSIVASKACLFFTYFLRY